MNELVQLILIFLKEIGVQEQSEIPMKSLCSLEKQGQPDFESLIYLLQFTHERH